MTHRVRSLRTALACVLLTGVTACSSTPHRGQAERPRPSAPTTAAPMTLTNADTPTAAALTGVLLTAADVTRPVAPPVTPTDPTPPTSATPTAGATASPSPSRSATTVPTARRVTATPVPPADDARVRTLLTWCTHTASTEDAAPTVYGPRLTATGPHGRNFVYSYARTLPAGTGTEVAGYAGRLAHCWSHVLLPVMAATLDPHIADLTQDTSVRRLPATSLSYGSATAVEGIIHWHPTPAQTETSVYDVAVVFGAHSMVTLLAGGADGLTTGTPHLQADVETVATRIRAAEHRGR